VRAGVCAFLLLLRESDGDESETGVACAVQCNGKSVAGKENNQSRAQKMCGEKGAKSLKIFEKMLALPRACEVK
jgi:hypothetical protein